MKYKWAKEFAKDTWNRIKFSRSCESFKIYETTITQNMIYSLLISEIVGIKIYESKDEKTNGNDLEFYIEKKDNKFSRYAVQSKIAYKSGRYEAIKHYNRHTESYQIENLLGYARQVVAIPLYFFYSYSSDLKGDEINRYNILNYEFGVAVASAHRIFLDNYNYFNKKWKQIPNVEEILINKNVLSFPEFVCNPNCISHFQRLVFEPVMLSGDINKYLKYTCDRKQIINDSNWEKLVEIPHKKETTIKKKSDNDNDFNPKFRILINKSYDQYANNYDT